MRICLTVTEYKICFTICKGGITQKLRKGEQPLLYVTHFLDLQLIPIKLHEDIPNVYRCIGST